MQSAELSMVVPPPDIEYYGEGDDELESESWINEDFEEIDKELSNRFNRLVGSNECDAFNDVKKTISLKDFIIDNKRSLIIYSAVGLIVIAIVGTVITYEAVVFTKKNRKQIKRLLSKLKSKLTA
jgi:hypothetical protein